MTFRPLEDGVLIRRADPETVTKSGIILPEAAKRETSHGRVVAVGPGTFKSAVSASPVAPQVKVGDTVYFGKYGGQDIELGGEKFVIFKEGGLLGVVPC